MKIVVDKDIKIGVAVSGGVDSMVMLNLVAQSSQNIVAINVDHSIRGDRSKEDSAFVKDYCQNAGIKCLSFVVDAISYAETNNLSVELAARELRYDVFDRLLAAKEVDVIALAHHANDQTETVLMRLFRGTGARGMRGIVDRKGYIHPLISYTKKEIIEYAVAKNIPSVQDATNLDSGYTRNFIRNDVLPLIEKRYPNFSAVITKTTANFAELEDYLLSEITPAICENGNYYLPLSALSRHTAIAKKSIVECLRQVGVEKDIEYNHLESIIRLQQADNNSIINLPFGIDVLKEYDRLAFIRKLSKTKFSQPFDITATYECGGFTYSFSQIENIAPHLSFDKDKLPKDTVVRTREDGDKFKKYGGGTKSLADYFTDIKMPSRLRDNSLVIAKDHTIYAILGIEISENIKIDTQTTTIIKIDIHEEN